MKKIMITGIAGMDGSTLADKYIARGDVIIGIGMWHTAGEMNNIKHLIGHERFVYITGDVTDREFMHRIISKYEPDIFYNFAAISLVPESFKIPERVFRVNAVAVLNILEIIRNHSPKTRFYQASTSEQIGDNKDVPQNLDSRMLPNSPYAIAKLASYHLVRSYRNAYKLFAVNGMLWNHEGPRRGPMFVTRKITMAVANIVKDKQQHLTLGNMDAYRDWGLASDYCDAMILMMEADEPNDYAVNTGEAHTVREFVEEAFKHAGLTITWEGEGLHEVGKDQHGIIRVRISPEFYRPAEVSYLCGDYTKIKENLGWEPKTKFSELVKIMVENDIGGKE